MRNPLQDQLLKAGLVKKHKLAEAVREQDRQRRAKTPVVGDGAAPVDAARLQAERAEHDRALAAQRNAQARAGELRAQARQIVATHQLAGGGEIAYGFNDGGKIRTLLVDEATRAQLARGALVIARHAQGYALLPRAAADKVSARDPALIVLDHRGSAGDDAEDDYYKQFTVPDDLIW